MLVTRVRPNRLVERFVIVSPISFYANDLEPQLAERARAICTAAHVMEGPQLEACTLDTAVLGGAEAAKVFVRSLPIRAVLRPGSPLQRIVTKPIQRP